MNRKSMHHVSFHKFMPKGKKWREKEGKGRKEVKQSHQVENNQGQFGKVKDDSEWRKEWRIDSMWLCSPSLADPKVWPVFEPSVVLITAALQPNLITPLCSLLLPCPPLPTPDTLLCTHTKHPSLYSATPPTFIPPHPSPPSLSTFTFFSNQLQSLSAAEQSCMSACYFNYYLRKVYTCCWQVVLLVSKFNRAPVGLDTQLCTFTATDRITSALPSNDSHWISRRQILVPGILFR